MSSAVKNAKPINEEARLRSIEEKLEALQAQFSELPKLLTASFEAYDKTITARFSKVSKTGEEGGFIGEIFKFLNKATGETTQSNEEIGLLKEISNSSLQIVKMNMRHALNQAYRQAGLKPPPEHITLKEGS